MKRIKKIQGSILIYAIFIMLIILIIIGMLIMVSYLNGRYVSDTHNKERVFDNVNSGLLLALAKPDIVGIDNERIMSLFGGRFDTIRISKKSWGIFDLITVRSSFQDFVLNRMAFVGGFVKTENFTTLYLPDQKRSLAVCGNTLLHGNCMLPSAGIKAGQIEGRFYERGNTIYGKQLISENNLPQLRTDIKDISVSTILKRYVVGKDFSNSFFSEVYKSEITHSFQYEPLVIFNTEPINLKNTILHGNIIAISETRITIDSSSLLTDITICAPVIHIQEKFNGSLQCIASDSIILDKKCYLKYPSALFLNYSGKGGLEFMQIGEESKIIGMVAVNTFFDPEDKHISCQIEEQANITGQVYCNGYLSIKGIIYGSLYSQGILLKTSSGLYENFILDAVIDDRPLPDYYAGIDLVETGVPQKVMKWVY